MTGAELRARLATGPLLLDGGLGTLLIAAGLEPGHDPGEWNRQRPDAVAAVHRAYAEAGSDLVHTNTFGANPIKLRAGGSEEECRAFNALAVSIARGAVRAVRPDVLVAGDLGPTGALLPPVGNATEAEIEAAFVEQATALAEAGADVISIETMYDLREARAAVRAARRTGLAVLASLTFESRRRGFFTIMGDPLGPSLRALVDDGADAVGFNCSVTSDVMSGMIAPAREAVTCPVIAQPNAGQPRAGADGVVYDASPEVFAHDLAAMVAAGARLVGGCCGTTPEFIRAARAALP
jgi:methionine synthase I (cobalamin-dependent)